MASRGFTINGEVAKISGLSTQATRVVDNRQIEGSNDPNELRLPTTTFVEPTNTPPLRRYSEDILDVSEARIENSRIGLVEKDGISVFRPEILSIVDFMPIWKGSWTAGRSGEYLTPAGKLIDVQYNSLWLKRDTIVNLLRRLGSFSSESISDILSELKSDFQIEINKIDNTINQHISFITSIERAKDSLDIRTIPRSAFRENSLSIVDFFNDRMQIDKDKFKTYSDTKILMQLLYDFKSILEGYSFNLLNMVDSDRVDDRSPVKIDKTYTLQDGFTFAINQLRSVETPQNAMKFSFLNSFLNSLPVNPDDRIKLLTTIISKELRVSKGLGNRDYQSYLDTNFSAGSTGNPFDNIVGIPGDTIFEQPIGPRSLQSLLSLSIGENVTVLPFERKYVDSEESNKTFVPGSTYFIDAALGLAGNSAQNSQQGQPKSFNTEPFQSYVRTFQTQFRKAKSIIEKLFELSGRQTNLAPDQMIDSILLSYKSSIEGTTVASPGTTFKSAAIIPAIFALANQDNALKRLLFQYCLLTGLALNASGDQKSVFNNLAEELKTINAFPSINFQERFGGPEVPDLLGGLATLQGSIETVANHIQNRVVTLTSLSSFSLQGISANSLTFLIEGNGINPNIPTSTLGEITIDIPKTDIKNTLVSVVSDSSTATTNLIKQFVDLATEFTNSAAVNGENLYLLDDSSGRTRFNFMSTSTILLLFFETISSLVSKYSFSNFTNSKTSNILSITVYTKANDYVKNVINNDIVSNPPAMSGESSESTQSQATVAPLQRELSTLDTDIISSPSAQSKANKTPPDSNLPDNIQTSTESFTYLKRSLISVRSKIAEEKRIKENVIDILSTIRGQLINGKSEFMNGLSPEKFEQFLNENSIQDLEIVKNPAQVRLAKVIRDNFVNKRVSSVVQNRDAVSGGPSGAAAYNFLLDEEVVFPETRDALFSLLSEDIFLEPNLADIRTKVITVGVPAGFVKQLSDRVEQDAINESSFKNKQFDVVSINIYKRDIRFDDIVFKPQSFLFDLSLFEQTDFTGLQIAQNEKFDRILQRAKFEDFEELRNSRTRTIENIVDDDKYDFLTNEQKREIVRNHAINKLMNLYIRLLSGLRMEEATFLTREVVPGTNFSKKFSDLVFKYLREVLNKQIPNKPISEILLDPRIDNETKDILRLFTLGNSIFEPAQVRNAAISPKLFDRTFVIPFNTENFEVDRRLTNQTESGKNSLNQSFVQERLYKENDKWFFRPKDRNELAFEDYFITIESNV